MPVWHVPVTLKVTTICGKGQVLENFEVLQAHYVAKVWGGQRLASLKNCLDELKEKGLLPLGETWEVSRHNDGPSQVMGHSGATLLNEKLSAEEMPYLVKFIDTTDNLSIQVHPGDDYAKRVENSSGKTECWLVLASESDGGIYLGFKEGVTKEQFKSLLDQKGNLSELMVFYPVKRGDFFFVPAGTIHAIGKGVTLAEIQQNSGITYRVWDWNRLGMDGQPRELHIDKALDVINFEASFNRAETFKIARDVLSKERGTLIEHSDFKVDLVSLEKGQSYELAATTSVRKRAILCLEGSLNCVGKKITAYQSGLFLSSESFSLVSGEELSKTTFLIIS